MVKKSRKQGVKWEKVSRKQPIVVYKYVGSKIVETNRFPSTHGKEGAMVYLRSQGCRFKTNLFSKLGNDLIVIPCKGDIKFEAECDLTSSQAVRRGADGPVEV